jgi:hypothetical protein
MQESEEIKKFYEKTLGHLAKEEGEEGRGDRGIGDFKLKNASGEKPPAERQEESEVEPEAEQEVVPEDQLKRLEAKKKREEKPAEESKKIGKKILKGLGGEVKKGRSKEEEQQLEELKKRGASPEELREAEATLHTGRNQATRGKMQSKDGKRQGEKQQETTQVKRKKKKEGGVVGAVKGEIKDSATRKAAKLLLSAENPVVIVMAAKDVVKKIRGGGTV